MTSFRIWQSAFLICILAVIVCVAYIDRPVAEFLEAHVRHTELWSILDRILAPFVYYVVAALFFILSTGAWALSGRTLAPWTQIPMLCAWSTMWAVAAETICKGIFGRGWPDPTYVQNHLYGFRFFHGGEHWASFPSGTATISVAIVAILWQQAPRLRIVSVLSVLALLSAVVAGNYHWVSDVIAGAFLGASIGWMTIRLQHPTFPTTH